MQRRPNSTLAPEPRPIRHLREFSNYLAPRTGLTSVDFWTLITTFIRNMFLNWLVLISWLAAAMMVPRLYLAAINLQPNWSTWTDSVHQRWNIGLTILLMVGFALIAVAMAYAIIDVPSTGNARLPQRRFLKWRQLPLVLASLILAAWWALFWNIHYGDPFPADDWLLRFVVFSVASYLSGGLLAVVIFALRKAKQKARPGRFTDSLWQLRTILAEEANRRVKQLGIDRPPMVERDPYGYLSPPLDGIWLRAPYLHNGSVPTLRDLLNSPGERPQTFHRGYDVFDPIKVGFKDPPPTQA